VDLYLHATVKD